MAEGMQKGIQKGRIEGRAEGKHNREIEIAKNAIKMGLDIKNIIMLTGLSKEEIEKLR
jgi:predicted transposase/invertase (TIGR01784 family)